MSITFLINQKNRSVKLLKLDILIQFGMQIKKLQNLDKIISVHKLTIQSL